MIFYESQHTQSLHKDIHKYPNNKIIFRKKLPQFSNNHETGAQ